MRRLPVLATLAAVPTFALLAYGQFTIPNPPRIQPPAPPSAPQQPQADIATTELRIAMQKAQIQASLADRTLQIKEAAYKNQGNRPDLDPDNIQADLIMSRAAADIAKVDVSAFDAQLRAGPAALQQLQNNANQQPPAYGQPQQQPNALGLQLLDFEVRKAHLQAVAVSQIIPLKQRAYDRLVAQQPPQNDRITDAAIDLEQTRALEATTSLDEQLMNARYTSMGGRR